MQIVLAMIAENVRKPLVWHLLKEENFVSFIEPLNKHDENCRVMINGITFQVSKEVISLLMGLAMRVTDEMSLQCFFMEHEELI